MVHGEGSGECLVEELPLAELKLDLQAAKTGGSFERSESLPLPVLDDLKGQRGWLLHGTRQARDGRQPEALAGREAPFTAEDPITALRLPLDWDGAQQSMAADGEGEVGDVADLTARLIRVRVEKAVH